MILHCGESNEALNHSDQPDIYYGHAVNNGIWQANRTREQLVGGSLSRIGTCGPIRLARKPYSVAMEQSARISEAQCWQLLGSASVGRLSLSMNALPAIFPVQYYLDEDGIAACLGGFEIPERSAHDSVVAFAADQIDEQTASGWIVNVIGLSTFDYRVDGGRNTCGEPTSGQIVHLEARIVTGHWLNLCPFIAARKSGFQLLQPD